MEEKDDLDKPPSLCPDSSSRRSTSSPNDMVSPRNTLTVATATVGVSALILPAIHSYPTVLSLVVALCAWGVVAFIKSSQFADEHFRVVWTAAVMLHLISFFIPAIAIWLGFRNRKPVLCSILVCIWCLCYLVLLYIVFPAPMGL